LTTLILRDDRRNQLRRRELACDAIIALVGEHMIRRFEFRGGHFRLQVAAGFVSANSHLARTRADVGSSVSMEIEPLAARWPSVT
jgi:hypothetical protein